MTYPSDWLDRHNTEYTWRGVVALALQYVLYTADRRHSGLLAEWTRRTRAHFSRALASITTGPAAPRAAGEL